MSCASRNGETRRSTGSCFATSHCMSLCYDFGTWLRAWAKLLAALGGVRILLCARSVGRDEKRRHSSRLSPTVLRRTATA